MGHLVQVGQERTSSSPPPMLIPADQRSPTNAPPTNAPPTNAAGSDQEGVGGDGGDAVRGAHGEVGQHTRVGGQAAGQRRVGA